MVFSKLRTPIGIGITYGIFAIAWIVVTDYWMTALLQASDLLQHVSIIKGIFFVIATGVMLYLLLKHWQHSLNVAMTETIHYKERLERVLRGSNDGWWDWDLEHDTLYYSPRWWQMLGYTIDELPPDPLLWQRLLHPDDAERVTQSFTEALTGSGQSFSVESRMLHKEGHHVPVLTRFFMQRDATGKPLRVSGTNMDISEQKRNEARLREAAMVFKTTREGVMVTDLEQRIIMVNHAFIEITGYTEAQVLGKPAAMLSADGHHLSADTAISACIANEGRWQGEVWNKRSNGEIYPALLSISAVRNNAGIVTNYVSVFADISNIKASETQLDFLAHYDALTQLPNRRQFSARLERAIEAARHDHRRLALLMIDLDQFKDINDSYGHLAGDELLQQVAARLTAHLGGADMVGRLGGDEFTVILDHLRQPQDAADSAADLMALLQSAWHLREGTEVRTGASIGISLFPDHGDTANELLQHADAALYQAKTEGRGCYRFFSENLTQAARLRIDLEARLHRALDRNEFRVFYQPQIDIASGRIIGAEALVRWQDPVEGLILPGHFIAIAENSGLIGSIGQWVLRETCLQGQRWAAAGLPLITLAVNLSARQVLYGDIAATVSTILAETGFPASRLELELTESALMEREHDVVQLFDRLRTQGVRLAIDDFGTGYSSLAHLKRFPLDVLKIDKSFVDDIPVHKDDMEITAAIIAMGHTLGFKIIAEGVENAAQLAFLQSRGCDQYQGYLFSPPLPAEAFAKMLAAH